jgi:hypothetical protein
MKDVIGSPTYPTAHGQPPDQFCRHTGRIPRLAWRGAFCTRLLGLEFVEPLAEIGQPVGVWSRQNRLPKVPKNRTKPAFSAIEGGRTIWSPLFGVKKDRLSQVVDI